MRSNDLQADFGMAYVKAVAHAAGFFCQEANRAVDADGVDVTLLSPTQGQRIRAPRLDLQVKTTRGVVEGDPFPYDLDAKNYNELCDTSWQTPRILVLVVVPPSQEDWVVATAEDLRLRRCGYWTSLRGRGPTDNAEKKRIFLSREALFHVAPLRNIMQRLCDGELP